MNFGGLIEHSLTFGPLEDAAADESWLVWRAPMAVEVKRAYAVTTAATGASGTNYFSVQLQNGGADGTGSSAVTAAIGGTGGWAADTPVAATVSEGTLASGDWLKIVYDEEGTVTPGDVTLTLDYVLGIGA
jgi:hypothetical protein